MTFLTIGKSGHVLEEQAAHKAGKGRWMGVDRLLPLTLSVSGSLVAATALDINWGAIAAGIGGVGLSVGGAWWTISSNKTKAFLASKAAELKVAQDAENSRIELLERESAARLKIQRAEAVARVKIQREQEEANRDSLEAKVKKLEEELKGSRDRRHAEATRFDGMLKEQQYRQMVAEERAKSAERKANDAALRVARLEGQLGITEKVHSDAINANADNIQAVADVTGTSLPAPTPHVEPSAPDSGDDFEPFAGRFHDNHGPDAGPLDSTARPNH